MPRQDSLVQHVSARFQASAQMNAKQRALIKEGTLMKEQHPGKCHPDPAFWGRIKVLASVYRYIFR